MKKKKKFSVTLIEIMIVILLIGMITGALAFNMSGSLDKGRAFKTEQTISRIKDILLLEYASGADDLATIAEKWTEIISNSALALEKGRDLMRDGWKEPIQVSIKNGEIVVTSTKLQEYKTKYAKKAKS